MSDYVILDVNFYTTEAIYLFDGLSYLFEDGNRLHKLWIFWLFEIKLDFSFLAFDITD